MASPVIAPELSTKSRNDFIKVCQLVEKLRAINDNKSPIETLFRPQVSLRLDTKDKLSDHGETKFVWSVEALQNLPINHHTQDGLEVTLSRLTSLRDDSELHAAIKSIISYAKDISLKIRNQLNVGEFQLADGRTMIVTEVLKPNSTRDNL